MAVPGVTIAKQKSLVIPGRFLYLFSRGTCMLRTLNLKEKPLKPDTETLQWMSAEKA
jgi:hypothetical protein